MKTLERIGRTEPEAARLSIYTVEYTRSEHRGIIMHAETCNAKSAAEALAHAKSNFADVQAKYGARGYRVKDGDGSYHGSEQVNG